MITVTAWGDMTREDLRQVFEIAIETLTLFI